MLGFRKKTTNWRGKTEGCRLLTPEEMDRNLSRERERCDRYCQYFSLVIVRLPQSQLEAFALDLGTFLQDRLRLSDDAGYLRKGGIGILLPMTDLEGAQSVLSGVHQFAKEKKIAIETELFTYSGRGGNGPENKTPQSNDGNGASIGQGKSSQQYLADPTSAGNESSEDNLGDEPGISRMAADRARYRDLDASELITSNVDSSFQTTRGGCTLVAETVSARSTKISSSTTDFESMFTTARPKLERRSVREGIVDGHREEELLEYCAAPFPKWKRTLDIAAASAGLLATAPIMIAAGVAIKMTSRGPIFFKQMRSGQYGKPFPVYKLRTMVVDAEELKAALQERNERDGPAFKLKDDPRVTTVGHFLRRVGADELPQLLNVLLGHMSIVGPRPLPIAEDVQCASWQRKRLDTKPGLTCTWQIGKSRGISFLEWMRLDRKYGRDRSLITDIKLVFKTIGAVIMGRVGH